MFTCYYLDFNTSLIFVYFLTIFSRINFLLPFDLSSWLSIGVAVALVTFCLAVLCLCVSMCQQKATKLVLFECLLLSLGSLFQEYYAVKPAVLMSRRFKFAYITWVAGSFFLVMAYNSNLRASLVGTRYHQALQKFEEMLQK